MKFLRRSIRILSLLILISGFALLLFPRLYHKGNLKKYRDLVLSGKEDLLEIKDKSVKHQRRDLHKVFVIGNQRVNLFADSSTIALNPNTALTETLKQMRCEIPGSESPIFIEAALAKWDYKENALFAEDVALTYGVGTGFAKKFEMQLVDGQWSMVAFDVKLLSEGKELSADRMEYDFKSMQCIGNVRMQEGEWTVKADLAEWSEETFENRVLLPKGCHIENPNGWIAENHEEVQLSFSKGDTTLGLTYALAKGKTRFMHIDEDGDPEKELLCDGWVKLNAVAGVVSLQCSRDRIIYRDHLATATAKKLDISYQEKEIIQVDLIGDVQVHNYLSGHIGAAHSGYQYVIADFGTFIPKNQTLKFFAQNGGKVLFYDRLNNMQMSTREIHMELDPITKKESIRTVGKTRFTLIEAEWDNFKKNFGL